MLPRHLALFSVVVAFAWFDSAAGAEPETTEDEEVLRAAHVSTERSALLTFFRHRTLDEEAEAEIEAMIAQLASESFRVRERATAKLAAGSAAAAALLRQATRHTDPEVRWRAREALTAIERREVQPDVAAAAVRLLGRRPSAETTEVLLAYAPFAAEDEITDAVCLALTSAARHEEESRALLAEALEDEQPVRRGVAGSALCRAGCREQLVAVRRLLRDPDPLVRQRVASALLEVGEKSAVPVLIALLVELPHEEASQAESLLMRLAGEDAPSGDLDDKVARRAYRDAWLDWWQRRGDGLKLANIDLSRRWWDRTLIVTFLRRPRAACIVELDARGRTRWCIANLQSPTDARAIDERRVLIAEYTLGQVTERNHKGEILRQIAVPDLPLEARRLSNGNTFIVTRQRVVEVDRNGKEVWGITPNPNGMISTACPLRGGQVAVCYRTGELVRLDRTGKVRNSSHIAQAFRPSAVHMEALPNGHLLVPLYYESKVGEYDSEGKEIWSASFPRPTSVQRLPNGHTLVGGYTANVLVEIDSKGREVKRQNCEGRVLSAHRR
jgi:HEAT repeat protein